MQYSDSLPFGSRIKVTRQFYVELTTRLPATAGPSPQATAYRRFVGLLFLSPWRDRFNPGYTVIGHEHIAWCRQLHPKKAQTQQFLDDFHEDVLWRWNFDHDRTNGKARTFPSPVLSDWGPQAVGHRLPIIAALTDPSKGWVDLVTGRSWAKHHDAAVRKDLAQHAQSIEERNAEHPALPAMRYLHTLDHRRFTIAPERIAAAREQASELWSHDRPEKWAYVDRLLTSLATQPTATPVYFPSPGEQTLRIFSSSPLLQMPSLIRQTIFPDWIDLDLASSQLAIVAHLWGIESLKERLASGKSIWPDFYDHMGCGEDRKADLKVALYAVCYGMWERNLALNGILSEEESLRFRDHEVIAELLKARRKRMSAVKKAGKVTLPWFDSEHPIEITGRNPRSLLAQEAQGLELFLMLAAFDEAELMTGATITLFQHDGVSLKLNGHKRQADITRIQEAVNRRCINLAIPTHLEVKCHREGCLTVVGEDCLAAAA